MFIYPKELVKKVRESWRSVRMTPDERIPPLPPDPIVRNLLEVAYHASFMTEETRQIAFHVVFCPKRRTVEETARPGRMHSRTFPVPFDRARTFNESELLRLAPATDPTKVLIGVEENEDPAADEAERLLIWGLVDAGSSWWDFVHGESSSGTPPPDCLTISTSEPGNLVISRKGMIILRLQRGEIMRPTGGILSRGPVADFFDEAVMQIYHEVCETLGCKKYAEREYDDYPQRLYLKYFERIVFHIRRKQHGGTLLVVPDRLRLNADPLKERVMIKYPCLDERAWGLLVDSLVLQRKYLGFHRAILDESHSSSPIRYMELMTLYDELEEINAALSDSVKFVAALSGVDGAVILTDRLRLLGFGAEVLVTTPELSHVKVSHDVYGSTGRSLSIESFGTRHRSAFRFCSTCENSVAFVISQDGGVKAIKRKGDDIILWSDINLGLFGI